MDAPLTNRIMRSPPSCVHERELKESKIWMRSIQYFFDLVLHFSQLGKVGSEHFILN